MSETRKTVWIAGSTGLVGGFALTTLLERPDVAQVIAMGRRAPTPGHAKLQACPIDLTDARATESALSALTPPEEAFCALGTTIRKAGTQQAFRAVDLDAVTRFARAARQAGARHFGLVSAMGADAGSRIFYNQVKGQAEDALRNLGFASLELLRPSLLVGERAEHRPGERLALRAAPLLQRLLRGRLSAYAPIDARAVGRALARPRPSDQAGTRILFHDQILQRATP